MTLEDIKLDIIRTLGQHYKFEIVDLSDSGITPDENELSLSFDSNTHVTKEEISEILKKINAHLHIVVYEGMVAILVDANEPHIS